MAPFQSKKNIYVCQKCSEHIVTVDRDNGVTPFMIRCEATSGCDGFMKSSMYRVFDQEMKASHEWYLPTAAEIAGLSDWEREHVRNGGLLLRKADVTRPTPKPGEPR